EAFVSKVLDIPCSEWGVSVNFVQLEGFTRQIAQKPNFFDHEINLFDYASWASKVRETILNDVFTVKSDLLKYHAELMQLYERSSDGAIVPEVEFDKIEKILNKEMLTKYDPNPLPITLFELVKSQIRFTNEHIKELNLKDSVDWIVNLDLLKLQSEKLAISDSILNKIRRADIDRQLRYYSGFFDEAFGGLKGLETFLKVEIDKVGEAENYLIAKTAEVEKKLKFVTFNELEIPINPEEGNIQFTPFKPSENFISGIYRGIDAKKIYLARFNSSRISDVFITIPMESLLNAQSVEMVYREDQNTNSVYMVISQTAPAVQGIKTEFESSEVVKVVVDKYPCIGAKIDLATGQIIWQSEINLQGIPLSLQFSTQGNVIINYTTSEDENEFIEMNELGLLSENDGD
ncbi:MAG: hypothetical protein OEW75_03045, partial [Cyclobacteriaceae bacterium]|nr:hypothetical protein [Cyclobacteriaceae bacterium]